MSTVNGNTQLALMQPVQPMAADIEKHLSQYEVICCTNCGFKGQKDDFIDGNSYTILASDDPDCPVCGSTVES